MLRPVTLLVSACLLLAGCGFTPLYGSGGTTGGHAVQTALNDVYIDIIPDRAGQYLRNRLVDRFHGAGTPERPRYRLALAPLQENRTNLDITKTATTTRAELRLTTTLALRDAATGETVLKRDISAAGSYNILPSQFATRVSEDNIRNNILDDLARQTEQHIVLFLRR